MAGPTTAVSGRASRFASNFRKVSGSTRISGLQITTHSRWSGNCITPRLAAPPYPRFEGSCSRVTSSFPPTPVSFGMSGVIDNDGGRRHLAGVRNAVQKSRTILHLTRSPQRRAQNQWSYFSLGIDLHAGTPCFMKCFLPGLGRRETMISPGFVAENRPCGSWCRPRKSFTRGGPDALGVPSG